MAEEKHVTTLLPDDLYQELRARTADGKIVYEKFDGDKEPTKIWLTNEGKLMSRMPPEPYDKEITPYSQSDVGNGDWRPANARGDLILRLVKRGVPNDVAHQLGAQVYSHIPLNAYAKDEFIDDLLEMLGKKK